MNRALIVSRGAGLALAASLAAYGRVWFTVHRLRPIQCGGDTELAASVGESERLRDSDDGHYDNLSCRISRDYEAPKATLTFKEAFRTLKGELGLRPIFHYMAERIEAHLFVVFQTFCLAINLRQQLRGLAPA